MIEFVNVSKHYKDTEILNNFNLKINTGDLVVLIGPSGCGKTTTLKMINQLIKTTDGEIFINDTNIIDQNVIELRRNIGYVIQHVGLIPHLTIGENVATVPNLKKWSKEKINKRVNELLELVHLDPKEFKDRYPGELSGGQKQRVGIARAFAADPEIILMDEPFSALDPITRSSLQNEIYELQKEFKKTIVFVTHDMDEALQLADKICIMNEGKIVQFDTPDNILLNPINQFVEEFVGANRLVNRPDLIKVKDIMIKDPVSISEKRKVLQAVDLMRSKKVDSLLVIDRNNTFKGVIRLKDIRVQEMGTLEIKDVLDTDILLANKDDSLIDIFNLMQKQDYQSIPIVSHDNKVLGLVTKSNLLAVLTNQYIKEDE